MDPDFWLDLKKWDLVSAAIEEASDVKGDLFLLAGRRTGEFDLLSGVEFLPWFLTSPQLFIRNLKLYQSRLDNILRLSVRYVTEESCRLIFHQEENYQPPERYLSFLQGYIISALSMWGYELDQIKSSWSRSEESWGLTIEWGAPIRRYRRALEELFVDEAFFHAVAEQLASINNRPTSSLKDLLRVNRELRASSLKRETEPADVEQPSRYDGERYGGLFTRLMDGVFTLSENGTLIQANPAALKLLGYDSLDELLSQAPTIDELIGNKRLLARLLVSYRKRGRLKDHELSLRRKDGSTVELLTSAYPVQDPESGEEMIEGVLHDVTVERRMQRALGETHRFIEAIFLNNPSGLLVIDSNGWTVRINPRLEKMFALKPESIVGPAKYNILKDSDLKKTGIIELLRRALAGQTVQIPSTKIVKSGSPLSAGLKTPLYVSVSAFPLQQLSGKVAHVVISYNDITENFLMEQQLSQLQKLQSIHTLASGIAHDFNNILGAIVPNADMIMNAAGRDDLIIRKARSIKTAAKRAATLTSKLMSFARESQGDKKPLELNNSVRESVELISNAIPKHLNIEFEPMEELPTVSADPLQIQQVLINLIMNASDASPRGGLILLRTSVTTLKEHTTFGGNIIPPGQFVCLTIADEGPGIDSDVVERVFDPFFTTKEKGRGTGLGLSVVHGIVKNHNGFIKIKSGTEQGTRFDVCFPVFRGESAHKKS